MAIDPAVKALLDLALDFECKLGFANSTIGADEATDNGRLKQRIDVADRWDELSARVAAVSELSERMATRAIALRTALANALHAPQCQSDIKPARDALEAAGCAANGKPPERTADSKADSAEKNPISERVLRAIKYVNDYNKKVELGKANKIPRNAILSIHLDKPVGSKAVKNLDRQLRNYRHRLRISADS